MIPSAYTKQHTGQCLGRWDISRILVSRLLHSVHSAVFSLMVKEDTALTEKTSMVGKSSLASSLGDWACLVFDSPGQQFLLSETIFIPHKGKALELLFVRSAPYTPSTVRTQ